MVNSVDWVVVGDNTNGPYWAGLVCVECRAGEELPSLGEWWKIVSGFNFSLREVCCSLCEELLPWSENVENVFAAQPIEIKEDRK